MRSLAFTLPFALPSLNVILRKHWAERSKDQAALYMEVMAAIGGPRHYPRPPFANARVTVTRIGGKPLDQDNLAGSSKALVDLLKVHLGPEPSGFGIIIDDSPHRCQLVSLQEPGPKAETRVVVEELPYAPPPEKPKRKLRRYPPKKQPRGRALARYMRGAGG